MASTILSDNGVTSGSAGLKTTAASDGALALQTTTAGGTATTALTIDTSQNVGIGTTSPAAKLDVSGSAKATNMSLNGVAIGDYSLYSGMVTRVSNGSGVGINSANSSDNAYIYFGSGTSSAAQQSAAIGRIGGDVLAMFTASTERMRIDSSGNVGIGTSSPTNRLTVNGGSGSTPTIRLNGGTAADDNALISSKYNLVLGCNADGNIASRSITFVNSTTENMRLDSSGNLGIGTTSPSQKLDIVGTTPFINIQGGATTNARGIQFNYNGSLVTGSLINYGGTGETALSSGTTGSSGYFLTFKTDGTERARILSTGQVNINTTGDTNALLVVNGGGNHALRTQRDGTATATQMAIINGNGQVGSIQTSGTSTSYNTSSDYRLKENIVPMTGALAKVNALKPVNFKWKSDGVDGQGFIAHELQEIIPDAVVGEKDALDKDGNPEYQGIDTSFLVATLTAAIQELKAINDTQAKTINALTARIVALEQA